MKYVVYLFTAALLLWSARCLIRAARLRHRACCGSCGGQCAGCSHAERPSRPALPRFFKHR